MKDIYLKNVFKKTEEILTVNVPKNVHYFECSFISLRTFPHETHEVDFSYASSTESNYSDFHLLINFFRGFVHVNETKFH